MSASTRKKVIVIGAGIAGLAACARLIEYGYDAIILEARDRCGGRIWTEPSFGFPLSLGAAWIHGTENNPMAQLATQFHGQMVVADPNQFMVFDRHGHLISNSDVQKFNAKFSELLNKAKELAYQSSQDIPLSVALSSLVRVEKLSSIEQDLFQKQLKFFEGYIGDNYEFLSARHWDLEERMPGANCFLATTYQSIIDDFIKKCPVQLNTIVTNVNTCVNNIEVVTHNAVFYADAVIVTLPLGVLKKNKVKFNPSLPIAKQNAIQRLGMGLLNVTALKFPTVFWPKEAHALFFTQFDKLSISIFINLYHFMKQPILFGYSGGESGRQLEHLSDKELIKKVMDNFKKVFGASLPEPESYVNTRWSQDPFSVGSYSYVATGASDEDYKALAEPVSDRLFFAGEATCAKYPATTHGAYLSGVREAERVRKII